MKQTIFTITIVLLLLAGISVVSAEFWACFDYGETINWCGVKPDTICTDSKDNGCMSCMADSSHDGCYNVGNPNFCNGLPQTCSGGSGGGGGSIDLEKPEITLTNPIANNIYNNRVITIAFSLSELSNVFMVDNNVGGIGARICQNCLGFTGYKNFKDGLNNITFKATDDAGNTGTYDVKFFVDSKKPSISKILPLSGYTNGSIKVEFSEQNPKEVYIDFGIGSGQRSYLDINSDCVYNNLTKKYVCSKIVDLNSYHNQTIFYNVTVVDIANNKFVKGVKAIKADIQAPQLTNIVYPISGRYISFNLTISEDYMKSVMYTEVVSGRISSVNVCSSLKNGVCFSKKTFNYGTHDLTFILKDKAGNWNKFPVSFTV